MFYKIPRIFILCVIQENENESLSKKDQDSESLPESQRVYQKLAFVVLILNSVMESRGKIQDVGGCFICILFFNGIP